METAADDPDRVPSSFDSARRTRRELTRLVDVARDLTSTLDPREVERRAVGHLRRLFAATSAAILLDEEGETAGDGEPMELLEALAAHARESADPVADATGVTLAARLRGQERIFGALIVRRAFGPPFRARDGAALALVAQQTATALENAWLYTEARNADRRLRESEKLAALGRLSAGFAHELRNPLNTLSILTFAMLERADERHRADLEIVRDEIGRMDRLLEQFLDFARPRTPRFARIAVRDVLERTLRLVAPEAAKRNVALDLHARDGTRPVWADGDQLNQVFLNLSLNALQAIGRDGHVEVSLAPARGGVLVRFADDGPGVPEDVRRRLFEPFVTTKPAGSGLGLAVAVRIVESHSGWLSLDSTPGRGAVATLWLPS